MWTMTGGGGGGGSSTGGSRPSESEEHLLMGLADSECTACSLRAVECAGKGDHCWGTLPAVKVQEAWPPLCQFPLSPNSLTVVPNGTAPYQAALRCRSGQALHSIDMQACQCEAYVFSVLCTATPIHYMRSLTV